MAEEKKHKDGRNVLIWIVGFFLTFMIVDAIYVYLAIASHTGVVEQTHGK